jgi:EF-P beta-lysylation protein EpmB
MPLTGDPHLVPTALTWQQELARGFDNVGDLLRELELDPTHEEAPKNILKDFPLRVPRGFVARMRKHDYADPLLRQVLPLAIEAREVAGFVADPVGDLESLRGAGILQKYQGRALLIVTGACGVHCRYCFRRAYPYREASTREMQSVLALLAADPSIEEVILSGGDPLTLSDTRLGSLLAALGKIPHVSRLRIHTRLPIVLPERVDAGLLEALRQASKPLVVVLHSNHANELADTVAGACSKLSSVASLLLNQSVLLRGVNDSADALVALSERLFDCGIQPYYLHQLDRVAGAAHFEVSDQQARELITAVAASLPGYLVPKLVREIPGAEAKTLLNPA